MVKNSISQLARAASPIFAAEGGKDKCYGISKAGENDCASAGGATTNYDGEEWKYTAKGACEKMGGKLEAFKNQGAPAKSS